MKLALGYLTSSISIIFISWIIGLIISAFIKETYFYKNKLSNLNFIRDEDTNRNIGLYIIKWIIKNTFFKFFNQKLKLNGRITASELKILRYEMTKSEIDHLIAFVFVLPFVLFKIFNQQYLFATILMIVNTLMNLYPSLLQQQNKRRIDKSRLLSLKQQNTYS
ncbi:MULTISPECIES: hypothetical protein [Hymenobacter]|uniref:Glycosyl-4,4'-diaponeurosporenoate acyltransferase n=2 Tax=Hymenobacter TaxID=89966 RepID=A0ABS6X323_9BACT|nr:MULTISPECIES: hypothetical protein [Hymenobacter]MBO3272874.1 hypothetical protein [Hymenobacter defluvii]MBW3129374.1 hypothetical protein [Hymenobacter profundi]